MACFLPDVTSVPRWRYNQRMGAPREKREICVHCRRRPIDPVWRPFCSERCKLLDLGEWLGERYRVAGAPVPADQEDRGEPDDR